MTSIESHRSSVARWDAAHREKRQERSREYRARQRVSSLRSWHSTKRYSRYGVTAEWFRDQIVGQAGRCAICGSVFRDRRDTHLDHDHETNQARGLLCHGCNLLLGNAKDSPDILNKAITYLEMTCRADPTGRP